MPSYGNVAAIKTHGQRYGRPWPHLPLGKSARKSLRNSEKNSELFRIHPKILEFCPEVVNLAFGNSE